MGTIERKLKQFAHGLLLSIAGMNSPNTVRPHVLECPGCEKILTGTSSYKKVPVQCPDCGRRTTEIAREAYFIMGKRKS